MPPIHLPVFQHFDCHSCGYCCRNLVVNVTKLERGRILAAGWADRLPGQRLFHAYRFRGRRLHRLAQKPDGRCIFLGDDQRCRLHAETGIGTKPLACRLYPFVPTPGVGSIRLEVRADCPSVAANKGRGLFAHQAAAEQLAAECGTNIMQEPPPWRGQRRLSAVEFEAIVNGFDECLREKSFPFRVRLRAGCHLLGLLGAIAAGKVRDQRFVDLIRLLTASAMEEAQSEVKVLPASHRIHRLFRQWLFLHALSDDPQQLDSGPVQKFKKSWIRYGQARRFARGSGPIPLLAEHWPQTDFESVARVRAGPDDILEPVCRTLRVKIQAHAFAGPAYYGYDLISGLTALWLLPSVIGWFARLAALTAGRQITTAEDILNGVRQAHHTFGVSPVFSRFTERLRLRAILPNVTATLLAQYGP